MTSPHCVCGERVPRFAAEYICGCGVQWANPTRAGCTVLGCRRTFKRSEGDDGSSEYICGNHYRMADKWIRTLRAKLKRRGRRHGWSPRMERIDNWLWARAVKQATERSIGI